jgi:tryptophan-rich sensory protein
MGISLFLVWREGLSRPEVKSALYIFAAQLIVNVLWSGAFFGLRSPLAGIIAIAVLWALIRLQSSNSGPHSGSPFFWFPILWVSFCRLLNFSIWRLNS